MYCIDVNFSIFYNIIQPQKSKQQQNLNYRDDNCHGWLSGLQFTQCMSYLLLNKQVSVLCIFITSMNNLWCWCVVMVRFPLASCCRPPAPSLIDAGWLCADAVVAEPLYIAALPGTVPGLESKQHVIPECQNAIADHF